jgi:adenylate cyclase
VTSGDAVGVATGRFNKAVRKTDRRFFVREHFGHLVNGDKSEQLFEGGLKLDGEEREVAVIACRLGGEKITLAAFNKFCAVVVDCVEKHGGGIDQVSHGLVVALFNAPLKIENAENEAREAANEIKERLAVFVAQQKMQAGLSLQFGLGFTYGKALLGLLGPKGKQRYSALGTVADEALAQSAL